MIIQGIKRTKIYKDQTIYIIATYKAMVLIFREILINHLSIR